MVQVGQKVTGKFQTSRGKGTRTELMFAHGVVTEVTEEGFKVDYEEIKGTWPHRMSEIDKNVYLKEPPMDKIEEQLDYQMEKERLGIEE